MKRRRVGFPAAPPSSPGRVTRTTARNPSVRLTLVRPGVSLPEADPPLGPAPETVSDHLVVALALIDRARCENTVSGQGDALLIAIEHAARALEALFDRETARRHLMHVAEGI